MKRMHVHLSVEDIGKAVGFYSALFAEKPAVVKDDYAKWMLDDPRVNFAISDRSAVHGLDHLGIQVDSREELDELAVHLDGDEPAAARVEAGDGARLVLDGGVERECGCRLEPEEEAPESEGV